MTTTTRPTDEFITSAALKALASGAFEPGRLERAMWLALDPRSVILPGGEVDVPSNSLGFVVIGNGEFGLTGCRCADNAMWCKHRIAAALLVRAAEADKLAQEAQGATDAQTPTPDTKRPEEPVLDPVNPTPEPAPAKRRKAKVPKSTAASVEVPLGGIREFKSTMTLEERARAMKALWG